MAPIAIREVTGRIVLMPRPGSAPEVAFAEGLGLPPVYWPTGMNILFRAAKLEMELFRGRCRRNYSSGYV